MGADLSFFTWNIACGGKAHYGKGAADIAAFLRAQQVDFAVMQEVDRAARRTEFTDFPRALENASGMGATFVKSIRFLPEDGSSAVRTFGNVLLSRHKLLQVVQINLGPIEEPKIAKIKGEAEPRSAVLAQIMTPEGVVWVGGTHLAYSPKRAPSPIRAAQVLRLVAAIDKHVPQDAPFVFGGDFNARAECLDLAPLYKILTHVEQDAPTFPLGRAGEPPHMTIDHVFVRQVKVKKVEVVVRPDWSDHAGVGMVFTPLF